MPPGRLEDFIVIVRGHKVMIDSDLAVLYQVPTKLLKQAIRRNRERFPEDFMFELTLEEAREWLVLKRRVVQALDTQGIGLRSQIVTLKTSPLAVKGRGKHLKYRPFAFTEQGVAMLSSVLQSSRAIQVNIEIMRTFARLRQLLSTHTDLARKLNALEEKYDSQFKVVFDAIRELMTPPPEPPKGRIGFHQK